MSTSATSPTRLRGITWDHPRGYDCLHAAATQPDAEPAKAGTPTGDDAAQGWSPAFRRSSHAPEDTQHDAKPAEAGTPAEDVSVVRVAWDKRSLKDFGDTPLSELARTYDLLVIDHPHAGEAAASGELLPLDTLLDAADLAALDDGQTGPSFASYHYNGHLWALAIDAACQVASYRPDRVDPAELPRDWDGFFAFSETQRRKGRACGMALCPTDALCSFLTLSAQLGDAPDETGKWVSEATFVQVVDILRRVASACVPESLEWNPIRLYEAMATDPTDTLVYAPLAFGYTNYARSGYRPKRLAYGGIPGRTHALLGGAGIAVSAHSAHPEKAAAYALWLCQAERQRGVYLENGGQPAHPAVWRNPAADTLCGGFFSGTLDTLRHAYRRPRFPGWPHFQETLGNTVHACLRSELDAKTAWGELNGRWVQSRGA